MESYTQIIWKQFKRSPIGLFALVVLALFLLVGIYAPLFASSKPLLIKWEGHFYSPLIRYLFFKGYYTKPIDLFFNLLMLTLPVAILGSLFFKGAWRSGWFFGIFCVHSGIFFWLMSGPIKDPECDVSLKKAVIPKQATLVEDPLLASFPVHNYWAADLKKLSTYAKINQILQYKIMLAQHGKLAPYLVKFTENTGREMPTLWNVRKRHEESQKEQLIAYIKDHQNNYLEAQKQLPDAMQAYRPYAHAFLMAQHALQQNKINLEEAPTHRTTLQRIRNIITAHQKALADIGYLEEKAAWFQLHSQKLKILIPPLVRTFHWEEDAGGAQAANQYLPWWELTRINRKDLISSLIFGIRVSLVVGLSAVAIAIMIGIPLGLTAGYFGGKTDLIICRFIEMWEAMPTFFMLLLIIAITQTKSIFLVISVLGIFGWTGIARFMRSEVLKQRKLSYVLACYSLGFTHFKTMFSHILPNAIPPILTLLPFSIMAAITSEAGLSFLGLGEEGSTSWGVLMDEGRSVFPAESYLLWPPAILLTLLLISIALVGDRLRDAIDPKMRS